MRRAHGLSGGRGGGGGGGASPPCMRACARGCRPADSPVHAQTAALTPCLRGLARVRTRRMEPLLTPQSHGSESAECRAAAAAAALSPLGPLRVRWSGSSHRPDAGQLRGSLCHRPRRCPPRACMRALAEAAAAAAAQQLLALLRARELCVNHMMNRSHARIMRSCDHHKNDVIVKTFRLYSGSVQVPCACQARACTCTCTAHWVRACMHVVATAFRIHASR